MIRRVWDTAFGGLLMAAVLLNTLLRGGASYRRWRWETAFGYRPPPRGERFWGLLRYAEWVGQMQRFR